MIDLLHKLVAELRNPTGTLESLLNEYDFLANGYRLVEDYAVIPLTQGLTSKVSVEDLPWILQHKWFAAKNTGSDEKPLIYPRAKIQGKAVPLHRFIMQIHNELPEGHVPDHENHDTLDNRRTNLRVATSSESMKNRRVWKKSGSKVSSQYKGVCANNKRKNGTQTWSVYITIDGKQTYLGLVTDELEGAKMYDAEAVKHHGEFAQLNFPIIKEVPHA